MDFIHDYIETDCFNLKCVRCGNDWTNLIRIASHISIIKHGESVKDYTNRLVRCISDNEYVIKKLLE